VGEIPEAARQCNGAFRNEWEWGTARRVTELFSCEEGQGKNAGGTPALQSPDWWVERGGMHGRRRGFGEADFDVGTEKCGPLLRLVGSRGGEEGGGGAGDEGAWGEALGVHLEAVHPA
jgi:hypothetical protein